MGGVFRVTVSNCMFDGGMRNKRTGILTNIRELADALGGMMCTGRRPGRCDRTGKKHWGWRPEVVDGKVVSFPTAAEAAYPEGFNNTVAAAIAAANRRLGPTSGTGCHVFSDIFAGLDARLSWAVAGALGVVGPTGPAASGACSSSAR